MIEQKHIERFEEKFVPEPNSGCWIWTGCINHRGYGRFLFKGRNHLAHRFAFVAYGGAEPGTLNVLHRCDNPPCVNPDHMFLGTDRDNAIDMAKKGRAPATKLRREQIPQIRSLFRKNFSYMEISERFNVSDKAIRNIIAGRSWHYVP